MVGSTVQPGVNMCLLLVCVYGGVCARWRVGAGSSVEFWPMQV